jgi:predicted nuclease of predicted toxin-antitoxin system
MLLADESVNYKLVVALRSAGYDVFSITEKMPSIEDEKIAALSLDPPRIIISQDKDFGEIVYHYNLKVTGVILLRYLPIDYNVIEEKLLQYLTAHLSNSVGKFIVITPKLTRIRTLPL